MKEKLSILLGIGVAAMVLFVILFYALAIPSLELAELLLIIIPIILVGAAIFLIKDRITNLRAGLPTEDERAKKLHWKAGAYTYYATIWIIIGIMWYNIIGGDMGLPVLTTNHVIAAIVLLSALCFFFFNFYFMKKGDI